MLCLLISQVVAASVPQTDVATSLAGVWKGDGVAFGRPSKPEVRWELVLGGKFLKLTYRTVLQSAKGEAQTFEGHAYYKSLGGGKYQGTWYDSQGSIHPIQASFDGSALTSNWGTAQTELGRTIYRLAAPDKMELVDYVQKKDGSWQEFGRAKLTRE